MSEPEAQPGGDHITVGDLTNAIGVAIGTNARAEVHLTLPAGPGALHGIPSPVASFTGRDTELQRLVALLRSGVQAAISGVHGLAGIGKSQLAFAAAQALAADYPDAQIYLPMGAHTESSLTPAQALQRALRAFHPDARLSEDAEDLAARYRSTLSGKRVLVLADNAADAAQVRLLAPPPGCALIITSRVRFTVPGMQPFDLNLLTPEDAATLLTQICPRIGADAAELARLCGYLPLALQISAGLLLTNDTWDIPQYLQRMETERLELLTDPDSPDDPSASVTASLNLSYRDLPPAVQAALACLGVFPADFDQPAALAVIGGDQEGEPWLDLLRRRSLLGWDASRRRYRLHDLVRVFTAERLEGADVLRLRHAQHYQRVAALAQQLYHQGNDAVLAGLALFDQERVNIDIGWGWAIDRAGGSDADALLLDYGNSAYLFMHLRYDARRERIPRLEAQRDAARRLGRRVDEGNALGGLGVTYSSLGDARTGIEYQQQSLVIARETGDRHGEARTLGNLGNNYSHLGDVRTGIEYQQQSLVIARETGDRRGEAHTLGNLGADYSRLGDIRKAIDHNEQKIMVTREIGDRYEESIALNNIGTNYADLGEGSRAISFYEQALAISRELGDQRTEKSALGNLGSAYGRLGATSKAVDYFEQVLAMSHQLGDPHDIVVALGSLGVSNYHLGDIRKAIDYYKQQITTAREIHDRRNEGVALHNLGIAYHSLGNTAKAIEYYEQSLGIARETGAWDQESLVSWNLGALFMQQGNLAHAVELMQVYVDYLHSLSHPDAKQCAQYVAQLRMRIQQS